MPRAFRCFSVVAMVAVGPLSPAGLYDQAKRQTALSDKLTALQTLLQTYPTDPLAKTAQSELITLKKEIDSEPSPSILSGARMTPHVPIRFVKLLPRPTGQPHARLLSEPGDFSQIVDAINRGFDYLSDGHFSLRLMAIEQAYLTDAESQPEAWLTKHPRPNTDEGFTVWIDYRPSSQGQKRYLGDGILYCAASDCDTLMLMHLILHGLGATDQDWSALEARGYRFDPDDRGLMTFDHGQLRDLGLEEKNRKRLGWPAVAVIRLKNARVQEQEIPTPDRHSPIPNI